MTPVEVIVRKGLLCAALSLFAGLAAIAAACGGSDDAPSLTPTLRATTIAGVTPGATSATAGSAVAGTRASGTAAAAGTTVPGDSDGIIDPTVSAELGGDIAGGDPNATRAAVSDVPTPPAGASPVVDSTEVAPPAADTPEMKFIVDMDAATFGVQSSRTVNAGDVFRVAVVMANIPDDRSMSAFNFYLDYDRARIVAPSYAGGPTTDRNPDLDEGSLGSGWQCIPAPEGDVDDPGGTEGDGDPSTGRALLSCFNPGGGPSGTVVLAVVEFHAAAAGEVTLSLSNVGAYALDGTAIAKCPGDVGDGTEVPCEPGLATVR